MDHHHGLAFRPAKMITAIEMKFLTCPSLVHDAAYSRVLLRAAVLKFAVIYRTAHAFTLNSIWLLHC